MNRILRLGLLPVLALACAACGDSAADDPNPPGAPPDQATQEDDAPIIESPPGQGTAGSGEPSTAGPSAGTPSAGDGRGTQAPTPASGGEPSAPPSAPPGSPDDGSSTASGDPTEPAPEMASPVCHAPMPNESPGNACYGSPPPTLTLTEVASGLERPVFVTHAPGDASRLFIIEQAGTIRILKDGELLTTPFIDLSGKTRLASQAQGERGLLGLAFAPDYATSKRFWVDYTDRGGNTVVEGYTANADGDTANADSATPLFAASQPAGNHNGGMLAFGPDHCLYVAMGDGGLSNDAFNNGQNAGTPLAGILRFDVDNPSDTMGAPGNMLEHPHLWNYGLRNPWRFSFDRQSGDLYIGDVGQGAWEEVDVEPRGVGGRNYGWPCEEGFEAGPGASGACSGDYTAPAAAQPNGNTQNQSVIGGYVYRGSAIPQMEGRYVYADFNSRKIWTFTWQGDGEICDEYELTEQLQTNNLISSFGEDAAGELYVVEFDASNGRVLRIDPR